MSDTVFSGANQIGSEGLQAVTPHAAEFDTPQQSAELPGGSYDESVEEEADLLFSIYLRGSGHATSPVLDFAREVNTFCRNVLVSIESLESAERSDYEPCSRRSRTRSNLIHASTETEFNPPAGPLLNMEEWLRLHTIARRRLDRFGYLMTQRDKKYISRQSGIEVTSYIWATLVARMGLRRIKNPYTSSNLVIYVRNNRQ